MSAALEHPRRHAVSAREYLRMGEAGVFAPDARLELIEGEIIEMAPIGPPHASVVAVLTRLFVRQAGDAAFVWVQNPVIVGQRSMPQPDLAILEARTDDYSSRHPAVDDVLLAIEVSDSTLAFDLGRKASLYARAGIRELWVVDVNARELHVHREPAEQGYARVSVATREDIVPSIALPEIRTSPREIFRGF